MLVQIHAPAAASLAEQLQGGDASDAVDLLLGCHARIRHFTAVALRLSAPGAPASQIAPAAAAVARYYSQALPLHEADENDSVYPRLRAALAAAPHDPALASDAAALAAANEDMVAQHRTLNALVDALLPRWQALAQNPADAPATAPATAADAARLLAAWQDHLGLEERVIFPALRRWLTPGDRAAVRAEMVERRNPAHAL